MSTNSHQLRNGLYVSGRSDSHSRGDRLTALPSLSAPYTGGDLDGSGELEKMFDIPKSIPSHRPGHGSGSGPFRKTASTSSSSSLFSSGPNPLQPTGLITSGPLRRSDQQDNRTDPAPPLKKPVYGSAVTNLKEINPKISIKVSQVVIWMAAIAAVMALVVGIFLTVAVRQIMILIPVAGFSVLAFLFVTWNCVNKRRGFSNFLANFPDSELRGAADGQLIKVSGIVTCGSVPLLSSYQKEARCVYVSSELYERRRWTWTSRYAESHVSDFYVSDFQSGLRALVKAGFGAKVVPFVKPSTVVAREEKSPELTQWLADRNLTVTGKTRLDEGYIKEGSSVSVVGVARRHENMLMIVPPEEPVPAKCQWLRCLLPTYVDGLVLTCEDNEDKDVIPV